MSSLPKTMKVIEISEPGGPDVLKVAQRPLPDVDEGDLLIKVAAAGVNRPDCLQRAGSYPAPPGASDLPGLEVAGTVAAVGDKVTGWNVGDEVCALANGGGYAEYCATPSGQCLPVPAGLDMIHAAAIPETYFTVWTNVFDRGRLVPGETFLVHGGASGIGTTAIQLAVANGARVFATVGSADKQGVCERLGAERAINYREEDFVEVLRADTQKRGVDVILDMVGGDYINRNIGLLAVEGRLVQIAFLRGTKTETDYLRIMMKRLTLTGSTLRARPNAEKAVIAESLRQHVWPMLASGKVSPQIFRSLPFDQAAEAHRLLESNEVIGKVVLEV